MHSSKTGVLLINLGTPAQPTRLSVWRYLNEFLSDPRVVALPALIRLPLVWGVIAPLRAGRSSEAYQSIWGTSGSPLLTHSLMQKERLQESLGRETPVALGMRYGQPSIQAALAWLLAQGVQHIKVLPLFPQYASAATGSAIEKVLQTLQKQNVIPSFEVIADFYDHPLFIQALAQTAAEACAPFQADFMLMSFHGLPEQHVRDAESKSVPCDHKGACPAIHTQNQFCYRAQCYATAKALAAQLGFTENEYQIGFQSRLGKTPWIKPYTDAILPQLKAQGVKRLAVICPSFVADCLETLEEIGIRLKNEWLRLGGEAFLLVPSVNAHPAFIRFLAERLGSGLLT